MKKLNHLSEDFKTRAEKIIEAGSVEERSYLKIYYCDVISTLGEKWAPLSAKQYKKLCLLLDNCDEEEKAQKYFDLFLALKDYGWRLSEANRIYQISIAILNGDLTLLNSYKDQAKRYSLGRAMVAPYEALFNKLRKKDNKLVTTDDMIQNIKLQDARFRIEGSRVVVDGSGEGNIDERISNDSKICKYTYSCVKAHIQAIQEVTTGLSWCVPSQVDEIIKAIVKNKFAHALIANKKYYREDYLKRQVAGDKLTAEDEACAVIPCYIETDPDKETLKDAKAILKPVKI